MNTFYLEVLSPERVFYKGKCLSMVIPISDGMLGIMANHTPLTAAIPEGEISFTTADGEKLVCAVTRGIADVSDNRVTLLCESALAPEEINEERERRHANEALIKMKVEQSTKNFKLWQLSFNKSMNRLKTKSKNANNIIK